MDVTPLPFHRHSGLEPVADNSGFLVCLPAGPQYGNHLGTVHASPLLAVAEAASGALLVQQFGSGAGFVPVVRRLEAKFRKPARGRVWARCSVGDDDVRQWSLDLAARGRVSVTITVEVVDADGVVVLSASADWFVARTDGVSQPGT